MVESMRETTRRTRSVSYFSPVASLGLMIAVREGVSGRLCGSLWIAAVGVGVCERVLQKV